jgi:cellulose synthase/poly-beta-1,6-N-acetylglucosamine synthase-like glycosyltransferase
VRTVYLTVVALLTVYFVVYLVGTVMLTLVAAAVTRRRRHALLPSTLVELKRLQLSPGVSVCVAAYNESAVIVDTVRSLLALDYGRLEVVVANDGSTDQTMDLLRAEFGLGLSERSPLAELPHKPVRGVYEPRAPIPLVVIDKPNGGRSDALNAAIAYARGPLVTVLDADEIVEPDAIVRVVKAFLVDPERTVAVGAGLGVANGCKIERGRIVERDRPQQKLPLFQAVEYERAFQVARLGAGALGAMPLIAGGFGVFRRDVLVAIGGYHDDTIGEDFDLTLRLHRLMREQGRSYTIGHVPNVVCWTIVPDTARVLARQRRRWHRGLQQVLVKHRSMMFRPRYHVIGVVGLPWGWAYELFSPIVIPIAMLTTLAGYLAGFISGQVFVLGWLVAWLIALATTLAALLMTESPCGSTRGWRGLGAVVIAVLVEIPYQCMTLVYRIQTLLRPRQKVVWGEMERSLSES